MGWKNFESLAVEEGATPEGVAQVNIILGYAKELHTLQQAEESVKKKMDIVNRKILDFIPETEGAYKVESQNETTGFALVVRRSVRRSWDKEKLEQHFGSSRDGCPDYVKETLRIPINQFEALSPADQEELRPCLTETKIKPYIKVIKTKGIEDV